MFPGYPLGNTHFSNCPYRGFKVVPGLHLVPSFSCFLRHLVPSHRSQFELDSRLRPFGFLEMAYLAGRGTYGSRWRGAGADFWWEHHLVNGRSKLQGAVANGN